MFGHDDLDAAVPRPAYGSNEKYGTHIHLAAQSLILVELLLVRRGTAVVHDTV